MGETLETARTGIAWLAERLAVSAPPSTAMLAMAALTLLGLSAYRPTWLILRHGVTIIHEMGHVVVAWLCGRRVEGIKLHTDTSGLAVSSGKDCGLGMLLTYLSGYTAPPLVGLALVWAATRGWSGMAMVAMVALLVAAFLLVRNLWGVVTVSVALCLFAFTLWAGHHGAMTTTVVVAGMFLLIAGVRGTLDLHAVHRSDQDSSASDASMAARNSLVPAIIWVWFFITFAASCAIVAASVAFGFSVWG